MNTDVYFTVKIFAVTVCTNSIRKLSVFFKGIFAQRQQSPSLFKNSAASLNRVFGNASFPTQFGLQSLAKKNLSFLVISFLKWVFSKWVKTPTRPKNSKIFVWLQAFEVRGVEKVYSWCK